MNNQLFASIVTSLSDMNDVQGAQVLSVIQGLRNVSQPVSQSVPVSIPEEPTGWKPNQIEGKEVWHEDFATVSLVGKQYRLYITCPVKGEKGEKIRYAIKASAKRDYGCKFAGDFKAGKIYWTFPDANTAKKYIADRKERAAANK